MEVWQNLKPESDYFFCLDAHSGYYQAEIEQSSRKYFCFLLDDGLYTFNHLPMGYKNSGHQFVQLVRQIFQDIDVQIEVDDFMIESPDVKTMAEKLRKLFQRARDRGVTFARRKLQFGKEVNFAGLTISKGSCKPQAKKMTSIKAFPRPANLTELRRFHGLLQTFRKFLPDLQQMIKSSQNLLKKDAE